MILRQTKLLINSTAFWAAKVCFVTVPKCVCCVIISPITLLTLRAGSGPTEHVLTPKDVVGSDQQFQNAQRELQTRITSIAKSKDAALAAYELLQKEMETVAEEDSDLHACIVHYITHGTFESSQQQDAKDGLRHSRSMRALSNAVDAQRTHDSDNLKACDTKARTLFAKVGELEATPLDVLSKNNPDPATKESTAEEEEEAYVSDDDGDEDYGSAKTITATVEGVLFADELDLHLLLAAATNCLSLVQSREESEPVATPEQSQAQWKAVTQSIAAADAKIPVLQSSLDTATNRANAAKSAIETADAETAAARRQEVESKSAAIAQAAVEAEAARAEYYTRLLQAIKQKSKEEIEAETLASESSLSIALENVDYSTENISRTKHFLLTCLANPSDPEEGHALLNPAKQSKWLTKPGIKYLRDTISRIMRLHRYRDGSDSSQPAIFDGPELDRKHKLNKAAKLKYLGKVITAVLADLGVTFKIEVCFPGGVIRTCNGRVKRTIRTRGLISKSVYCSHGCTVCLCRPSQ